MTDAVLSQIEQILQGIETRTAHTDELCGEMGCFCDRFVRVRTEIARTVERMLETAASGYEVNGCSPAVRDFYINEAIGAASVRAAGGTPQ